MSIPTILERSLIDSTLKSCCRGASLCVCSKREKWAGEFPELLGLRHQTLCFSFHYQLLTLHCLGPQFLFSSDLKADHSFKRKDRWHSLLTLRGHRGEGDVWTALLDIMLIWWVFVRKDRATTLFFGLGFSLKPPLLSGRPAVTSCACKCAK